MPIFLRQHRANYVELAKQEWDIATGGSVLSLTDEDGKTSEYQQVTRDYDISGFSGWLIFVPANQKGLRYAVPFSVLLQGCRNRIRQGIQLR